MSEVKYELTEEVIEQMVEFLYGVTCKIDDIIELADLDRKILLNIIDNLREKKYEEENVLEFLGSWQTIEGDNPEDHAIQFMKNILEEQ